MKSNVWVLIASVPGLCIPFTLTAHYNHLDEVQISETENKLNKKSIPHYIVIL